MSLKKCKECGHGVSTTAETCPNCGARLTRKPIGCLTGIVLIFVLGWIGLTIRDGSDNKPAAQRETDTGSLSRQKASEPSYLMDESVPMVLKVLKDPDSAKFRNGVFYRDKNGSTTALCGEVNSKNSFGAYGGFERYVVDPASNVRFNDGTAAFQKHWSQKCTQSPGRTSWRSNVLAPGS